MDAIARSIVSMGRVQLRSGHEVWPRWDTVNFAISFVRNEYEDVRYYVATHEGNVEVLQGLCSQDSPVRGTTRVHALQLQRMTSFALSTEYMGREYR